MTYNNRPMSGRATTWERRCTVATLSQELEKLPGPKVLSELLDFIESLLVIDHIKRPTALEALQHSCQPR
jgi:hypothetical protein